MPDSDKVILRIVADYKAHVAPVLAREGSMTPAAEQAVDAFGRRWPAGALAEALNALSAATAIRAAVLKLTR